MQLKVIVKFPTYMVDNKQESEMNKLNLETILFNLFSKTILVEKYSKTIIEITVDIVEYACDVTNYSIMAVTYALNNANIEQKGLVTCSNIVNQF